MTGSDARDRQELDVVQHAIEALYTERGYGMFTTEQRERYGSLLEREEELRAKLGLPTNHRGAR